VAQQYSDTREHHCTRTVIGEVSCEPNRYGALCRVEQQRKDSGKRASDARNVGGANVAATRLTHICFSEYSRQNQAKWNGAEKVGQQNQK
jgi:hypothetical protein